LGAKFIEVTSATVITNGTEPDEQFIRPGQKEIINVSAIVRAVGGSRDTSAITFFDGRSINVMESYSDLKKLLGL